MDKNNTTQDGRASDPTKQTTGQNKQVSGQSKQVGGQRRPAGQQGARRAPSAPRNPAPSAQQGRAQAGPTAQGQAQTAAKQPLGGRRQGAGQGSAQGSAQGARQPARPAAQGAKKPAAQVGAQGSKPTVQSTARSGANAPRKKMQPRNAQQRGSQQRRPQEKPLIEYKPTPGRLRMIPLGGVEEVGKNISVLEFGNDILVVDCGSIFPSDDMPGVDLVIPDVTYLQQNRDRLRGFLITHGHEDHIGAVPYILKQLGGPPVPIYGTRLTLALIEHKLKENRITGAADLRVIKAGDKLNLGAFEPEFIHVNHSIIDAVAIAIKTPVGTVIFSGDFKIDYTPIEGGVTDLQKFAELGRRGVLALFMESTNAERPGYTMSERRVGATFESIFPQAKGRLIIAMFSSNVHRVQQVVDSAARHGRMICLTGRSMINYSTVAAELGLLHIPAGRLIDVDDLDRYADEELVIVTTGSQGENMAGLSRMAFDEHRKLAIRTTDTVVLSATPIPGNEKSVSRVINQLYHKGANVIYDSLADVHVSGHACQEELKLIHTLVRPRFFVPIHGEYRHLRRHAMLAQEMGMQESDIIIPSIGTAIEFSRGSARIAGQIPSGQILLDGSRIGDVGNVVLKDRKTLAEDGMLVVVLPIDMATGELAGNVEIDSRGFVYMRESEELMRAIRKAVQGAVTTNLVNSRVDLSAIKNTVREDVRNLLYKTTRRAPVILPMVVAVKKEDNT